MQLCYEINVSRHIVLNWHERFKKGCIGHEDDGVEQAQSVSRTVEQ
jgi:hypothetical protein